MGYYSRNYRNNDYGWSTSIIMLVVSIAFLVIFMLGVNCCSSSDWNNGDCPKCETRYELRGASRGLKYYACPKCGKEVQRF